MHKDLLLDFHFLKPFCDSVCQAPCGVSWHIEAPHIPPQTWQQRGADRASGKGLGPRVTAQEPNVVGAKK